MRRVNFIRIHRARIWGKIPQDRRACSSKCLPDQNLFHKTRIFMRKSFLHSFTCKLFSFEQALREDCSHSSYGLVYFDTQ